MPKVSIVIPCYNVEKYIVECLDSVVHQTLEDIEIICVDDGSTDNTGKIIDEYAAHDNRFKVLHKENAGYGVAMNKGFDMATGEYIGIVEPDDYIMPNMYSVLYDTATKNSVDWIKADFCRFKGENETKEQELYLLDPNNKYYNKKLTPRENLDVFYFEMHTWAGIYNRKFIETHNIRHNETPGASYQDTGFWFQTLMYATTAFIIPGPFYMYRVDNPNASIKNKSKVFALKHEYDFIHNILKKDNTLYKFIYIFWYRRFCSYMWNIERVEKKHKKDFLNVFRKEFICAYKNNEIDENLFPENDLNMLKLIIHKPTKFLRKITNELSLGQKLFSVKNEAKHKVLCLFGIKFKIKNKFNELRTIVLEQQHQIHCLNNNLTEHQIQTFSFYNGDEYVKCNSLWETFIRQIDENQFYRICTKYFSFRDLKDYPPREVLMYIASCLNTNRIEKAQNMLSKYVDLFGLDEIWRFVQVAKFAHEQGLSDEKIEKAAFVFDKLEENRKNKVFEKLVEGKTVAVVGNGPSEIGKGKGSEIDSHDIVIRINNYQTEGFEQDYGSKTDIWVRGFGGEDLKDYTLNNNYLFAGITGDYFHIPLFWEFQLERIYRDLYSEILTAYISPDHYRRLLYEFEGDPTTGLSLIYTLLDLTPRKNVDFYGFSCFEDEFAGYATHYFNDRDENEARQRSSNHSFNEEAEYMRKLVRVS